MSSVRTSNTTRMPIGEAGLDGRQVVDLEQDHVPAVPATLVELAPGRGVLLHR